MYHEAMRIVCPACAAAYEVPEARLRPGLVVRCARCGADWAQPTPEPEPEPVPTPEPEAEPDAPETGGLLLDGVVMMVKPPVLLKCRCVRSAHCNGS